MQRNYDVRCLVMADDSGQARLRIQNKMGLINEVIIQNNKGKELFLSYGDKIVCTNGSVAIGLIPSINHFRGKVILDSFATVGQRKEILLGKLLEQELLNESLMGSQKADYSLQQNIHWRESGRFER